MLTPRTAVVVEVIKGGFELEGSIILLRYVGLITMDIIGSVLDTSI